MTIEPSAPALLTVTTGNFNAVSASALLSAVVSLVGGVGAWLLGLAPDWEDVRPLAWVGLSASLAAACSFTSTLAVAEPVYVWSSRAQVFALALHVAAWHAYLLQWGTPAHRRARWLVYGPLLAVGALALVPGAVFASAEATHRPVPWLGVVYHDPPLAPLGYVVMAVIIAYGLLWIAWLAMFRDRAIPHRRTLLVVAATILSMGVHDAALASGLPLQTPYLIDFALYLPAVTVAVITLRRIVGTATDLRRLRTGLEVLVVERTAALERSQAALFVSERLAALGQFAGGFAREVEHPVKVVEANLEALGRELRDDPRDRVAERLADAKAAVGAISALSRQLLLAGRAAVPGGPAVDVRLGRAVESALARGRARGVPGLELHGTVTPGATVSGDEDAVVDVLTTLVLDAMGRIPAGRPGAVTVRAERGRERVQISVEDDGASLSEEALLHAFEPFHESEQRRGAGLRRAVARGMAEGMGGSLRLERAGGVGTRAVLELAPGAPDASPADLPHAPVATPRRARILIADGDPDVLRAVVREVGQEHEIEAVGSVASTLAALGERSFDMVLCGAALPGGGGERLWQELLLRAPAILGHVAFLVNGAEPAAARAFLDRQPQPVLQKPFGLAELQVLMDWLGIRAGPASASASARRPSQPIARIGAP